MLTELDFLASFAAGTPNTVLLHELSPEGQTAGVVAEGDMQAKASPAMANQHTSITNPRIRGDRYEAGVGMFAISCKIAGRGIVMNGRDGAGSGFVRVCMLFPN